MSTQEEANVGGWSTYTCQMSPEAKQAFEEAMKGFVGVHYTPVAVSQQVVAGMNYKFFCNASPVTPNSFPYAAIVSVYKPLNGNARITGIFQIPV